MKNIGLLTRDVGMFKFTVRKSESGIIVKETDWMKNLITNKGRDRMGTNSDWLTHCQVGSGITPADPGDTGLETRIGSNGSVLSTTSALGQDGPDYYCGITKVYRFAANVFGVAYSVNEVGVSWGTTGEVFSRLSWNTGALEIATDEVLEVTYHFRHYAPTGDVTGTITLNAELFRYIARAAEVDNSSYWAVTNTGISQGATPTITPYTGTIAAITGLPTGPAAAAAVSYPTSYTPGDYFREVTANWAAAGSIFNAQSIVIRNWGMDTYQVGFFDEDLYILDPLNPVPKPIVKTTTKSLNFVFKHSWAERP